MQGIGCLGSDEDVRVGKEVSGVLVLLVVRQRLCGDSGSATSGGWVAVGQREDRPALGKEGGCKSLWSGSRITLP